ncbi:hypothetical protein GCM10025867_03450 [Frondihabitans sucicola]|uniref:Uncharacterized protein n=1 Tax=Frondihabitans sucicola TaxID=1268041 RepID=A0ABN6XSY5_9MICO|nr:hypothetical protein GCM10025867_03450 [Frondihabitans sucicola]
MSTSSLSALRKKYPEQIDLARARAACLTSKGWPVSVSEDASISANLRPGTEESYDDDDRTCLKELGVDVDAPPSDALLKRAYKESKAGAECLRSAGWQISRAPTYVTFKDTYDSDAWYPWAEVPLEDSEDAITACPAPEPHY